MLQKQSFCQNYQGDKTIKEIKVDIGYIQVLSLEIDHEQKKISPCLLLLNSKDTLEELRRIIDCSYVTCTEIEVNGKLYDVWSDDEGLLINNPVPTLYVNDELVLFGNLVFATNDNGVTTGLDNDDVVILLRYINEQAPKLYRWIAKRRKS